MDRVRRRCRQPVEVRRLRQRIESVIVEAQSSANIRLFRLRNSHPNSGTVGMADVCVAKSAASGAATVARVLRRQPSRRPATHYSFLSRPPSRRARLLLSSEKTCARSSARIERLPPEQKVRGSNPLGRTSSHPPKSCTFAVTHAKASPPADPRTAIPSPMPRQSTPSAASHQPARQATS
jgi:hypothetical protein